jgi:two-component system cell cycle sensor histidine kinase/response regulator CckA
MPLKMLDKIFDPYFTTKREGSGLGLAICHSIIRKHEGHIMVESIQGEGSTFIIYLPALKENNWSSKKRKKLFKSLAQVKHLSWMMRK